MPFDLVSNRYTRRLSSWYSSCARPRIRSSKLYLSQVLSPRLHASAQFIVDKITFDESSTEWSALSQSTRWNRSIIWTLVGFAGFGVVWSLFARIDETVSATGKLEPLGTTLDIKAPIGGVIKRINVKDGELVAKDQILLELDTTAAQARLDALREVLDRTYTDLLLSQSQLGIPIDSSKLNDNQKLRLTALRQEYDSRILASSSSVSQSEAMLQSTVEQLSSKRKALTIRERILSDITILAEQGAMARAQYLKELQEVELLRGEVSSLTAHVSRLNANVREARNKLLNTKSLSLIDFSTKVEESRKQIAQLTNQISEAKLTLKYQAIKAPKDGFVFDLQPASSGFVVNSDRPVLKIVPVDSLVARVFVPNRDIGFLKVGQSTQVRVDAFPYNEFGGLDGQIRSIGSDVLEPDESFPYYRFPVTVDLLSSSLSYKGRSLPLMSGMSVSANIILRQRPVISIFTQRIIPFWDNLEKL